MVGSAAAGMGARRAAAFCAERAESSRRARRAGAWRMISTLFRMPQATRYDLTWDQKALLDVIALLDGKPLHTSPLPISARVLRNVLDLKLVKIVGLSPGRYEL